MPPPPRLDARDRSRTLDTLGREAFDLLVIGGGITGAGVAREASLRGLRVALLEARDYAAGTSSRSSKLVHGGLRYLAQGEVALVRATALERKVVRRMAPHLAEPRTMLLPTRSRMGHLKMLAALATYDRLGAVDEEDRHQTWSREEVGEREPLLDREAFASACAYREYLTEDARLVLANLRAAAGAGAVALSHTPVVEILRENGAAHGAASGARATCRLSGREVTVRARAIVNAAGPWVDDVVRLEQPGHASRLHLSKGVHVVLPAEKLPIRNVVVLNTADRRSIFAIRRGRCVYLGTTDTSHDPVAEAWPAVLPEDVAYLLEPANRDFAIAPLGPGDVIAAWAGLRPLIGDPGKPAREISRKDEVWVGDASVVTVAGGKLTGYRPMAHVTLERAAEVAGLRLAPAPAEEPPLPGGDLGRDLDAEARRLRGVGGAVAGRLVRLYGSEATDVLALGAEPLVPGGAVVAGEVDWAVEREGACGLEDVLYRRTRAALYDPAEREALLQPMVERLARRLDWGAERRAAELSSTRARLASELAFQERR